MSRIESSDGVRLRIEAEGDASAPALVFSNSLGTNLHMWDGQMDAARGRFRIVRYDQRGHGESDAPDGPYTIERLGRDVIDLLDGLGVERAAFCGLSLGAMTGLWLAIHHPRRFTHMALCGVAAHLPPKDLWDGRARTVMSKGMAAIDQAVLESWFTDEFRARDQPAVERIRAMLLSTPPGGYSGCCAAIRDMDFRDELGLIEAPVLIVVGERDSRTTPEQGLAVAARVPGARSARLPSAHLANVEDAERFNRIVLDYLAGGGS